MNDDLTVAILVSRKRRRFGINKALASYQNSTLLEYEIKVAQKLRTAIIIVVGQDTDSPVHQTPLVRDIIPDCGPLGGVYTAIHWSKTGLILTMPCDLPLLPVKVFEILLLYQNDQRPVVARSQAGLEPLFAL